VVGSIEPVGVDVDDDGDDGDDDDVEDDDLEKQRGDVVGITKLDVILISRRMVKMTYIDTVLFIWYG